jgi:hypothetical protein
MTVLTLVETRKALFAALGAAIDAAPDAQRAALAQALESFAEVRSVSTYRRICDRSPLLEQALETIEEASGAYLFYPEGVDA